jgi:hypothetical protein
VPERRFTAEEVDRAVAALAEDPDRFAHAQEIVQHAAPSLQRVLNEALHAGGWFGEAHDSQVAGAAGVEDPQERIAAVQTLVAEETRLGMLVGVAVGIGLMNELTRES